MHSQQTTRRGRATRFRVVLLASIGFNLFLAGWWIGSVARPTMHRFWPGPGFGESGPLPPPDVGWGPGPRRAPPATLTRQLEGKLSAEGMREVTGLLEVIDSHFVRRLKASSAQRERTRALLAADVFDADAFARVLQNLQAQRSAGDAELARRVTDTVGRLSSADRKALAQVTLLVPPP